MNERDFFYWLQGFFELSGATHLDEEQVKIVKEHMALVVKKVTQSQYNPNAISIPSVFGIPPVNTIPLVGFPSSDPDYFKPTITCGGITNENVTYCASRSENSTGANWPVDTSVKCELTC